MKRITGLGLLLCLAAVILGLSDGRVDGTLKYKKETGKKCTFCHTGVPNPGDEDPQLNEDGKMFKRNGYKLTEEQKNRPPEAGSAVRP